MPNTKYSLSKCHKYHAVGLRREEMPPKRSLTYSQLLCLKAGECRVAPGHHSPQ